MKLFIGLMGVKNDGKTLVSPNGKTLFKVHSQWLARKIQRIQHSIAIKTWNFKEGQEGQTF